ncbi:MAG TPA: hypothetical protein VE092_13330, partial [Herbaspirillum sp.]|uniref:hypothetical protein n=1 Tax=Herbaspirillum sp. TaxID=1890675 RepID=UPI002D6A1594
GFLEERIVSDRRRRPLAAHWRASEWEHLSFWKLDITSLLVRPIGQFCEGRANRLACASFERKSTVGESSDKTMAKKRRKGVRQKRLTPFSLFLK